MRLPPTSAPALVLALALASVQCAAQYYGQEVGALSQLQHGVRGRVYAIDSRTIYIKDFHYDGEGPAAYFYVGKSKSVSGGGARLRDERGAGAALRKYRGEGVALSLPEGTTLKDYAWFAVWCDEFSVNFGSVSIPAELEVPRPVKLGALRGVHGVSSDALVVVDAQTLLIPHFSYDGEAPDAKFWVGRGDKPSPAGIRIPDENGKEAPLRRYERKTIVLTLPGELTVFDIGHFGVWCEAFTVDFGHVTLPAAALRHVPPSLRMLGVSPQSKLNCEVLLEELAFEVRWAVAGDSIVIQLVAKLEDGEYMSFGISGAPHKSQMVGGDVTVAWVEQQSVKGRAEDYYLDAKSQCAAVSGSCPDHVLAPGTNSVRLLNAALVNGYSIVTYQRSLLAADRLDLAVLTNSSQPVIWALGPRNERDEVSYHHHYNKEDKFIEFGRPPVWNCPMPEADDEHPVSSPAAIVRKPERLHSTSNNNQSNKIKPNPVPTPRPVPAAQPWDIPAIQCYEPPDGVFYAQMGPTGGKQGYSAITGHVGWGISWYINGLLIPEINVVRGKKYTFVVEGGRDQSTPARYHPFYITDDPVGGYLHKTEQEKKSVAIYAGVRRTRSGELTPSGVGRLCNWTPDPEGPSADEYPSFGAYQRALTLVCDEGDPGVVSWTPDSSTPDTVYYQCFTHRYLGWKINVLDSCDQLEGAESVAHETRVPPGGESRGGDLESEESVQVHSSVATHNLLDGTRKVEKIINTKDNYDNHFSRTSALAGDPPGPPDGTRLYDDRDHETSPLSGAQIRDVIRTVETIESDMREKRPPGQYQVTEDSREELPAREGQEYSVQGAPPPHLLPPGARPLTLQAVLRPGGGPRPSTQPRPPYRRPAPPDLNMRRPPPSFHKMPPGYPLPLPAPHGPTHTMHKKYPGSRGPPGAGRPPMKSGPPMYPPRPGPRPGPQQPPKPDGPPQSVVVGKPISGSPQVPSPTRSQTLSLGQADIVVNQVVKSQITLPGGTDAVAQHSSPPTYLRPGQIILGRPMEHPLPLDQQMTQTGPHSFRAPPTSPPQYFPSTTLRIKSTDDRRPQNDIKSSDFIGESTDSATVRAAVNTGFKPDSIVVESGFKPIIREPLMAAEDRLAYEGGANRREDTDVEEDYDEAPQSISNSHAYSSDKITESFEPMFIPSPPDRLPPTADVTREVFPSSPAHDSFPKNHAKEDRPHPVYVKTEAELNALFGRKNMNREVPEMVMDSDRVSAHYLPPDPKLPKEQAQKLSGEQTFTTYDGKTVSAATLTNVPDVNRTGSRLFSSKLPATTELLLKSPQFGPFRGEIPPPVADHVIKDMQVKLSDLNSGTTKLKLVNAHKPAESFLDDLKADGSERREVTVTPDEEQTPQEWVDDDTNVKETDEETEEDEYEEEDPPEQLPRARSRRDTHTQGYKGDVQPVHTNGHTIVTNLIDHDEKPSRSAASEGHGSLTRIVLLTLCLNVF